jgi:hypothetical protein
MTDTSLRSKREHALLIAAVDLHPGWVQDNPAVIRKLDPNAPAPFELIEWLYKHHPEVAKKIEAEIGLEW